MEPEKIQPDVKVDSKPPVAPVSVEETIRALTASVALQEARLKALSTQLQTARMDFSQSLDESFGQSDSPDDGPPRIPFTEGGAGLDLSKCALGYKINPNGDAPDLVRIMAGEIDRVAVAQTDVTVANDHYVYVRRTLADDTMAVLADWSVPADDVTYRYYRLYRFTVASGAATIQSIFRPFDIEGGGDCVTDIRYDPATQQLQKKTLRVPTWTMISGGQAEVCP